MLANLIGKNATTPTPLIYSRARFSQISARRPNVCDCTGLLCHFAGTPPPPPLFAKQQSAGGVWRQQILNSIQRKSKLGREEIQPVTISVSMAFRGLACSAVKKDFSIGLNAPIPALSLLPSHPDPSSLLLP